MEPLVSVILPTYNRPDVLARAVESVLSQTYTNFECIIVDDASMDETPAVVDAFDDDRIEFLRHEENRGGGATRNTGIEAANGDYYAFLDDDDEWAPRKLERQVAHLKEAHDGVGLVYCWLDYVDDEGNTVKRLQSELQGDILPAILDEQRIGNTFVVPAPVADAIGGFDESLPRGQDGDFIRRISRTYEVGVVPEPLVRVYIGHGHDRITATDPEGLRNDILASETLLEKFAMEFTEYPRKRSNVHTNIAFREGQLGGWRECVRHYARALEDWPTNPDVVKSLGRLAKYHIWR